MIALFLNTFCGILSGLLSAMAVVAGMAAACLVVIVSIVLVTLMGIQAMIRSMGEDPLPSTT